jgi:hypothetical protein
MKRWCALLLLVAAVTPARAHFIWIVPDKLETDRTTVRVIFSDSLEPDSPDLLAKISRTELFVCGKDGQPAPLKLEDGNKEGARVAALEGKGPWEVAGVCHYGVVRRGQEEPFLLFYYPKTYVRRSSDEPLPHCQGKEAERLALEILPVEKERATYIVRWHGKPLPGADVAVVPLGEARPREAKTDEHGRLALADVKTGIYGIRARHVENRQGDEDGKKYHEVRHYATLVVELLAAGSGDTPPKALPVETKSDVKADAEATRLLAEARAARANWVGFPGFTADVTVNLDGQSVSRGRVQVKADGKVNLELGDKDAASWGRRQLASTVGHRLDNSSTDVQTPCAFADEDETNPLGRAVRVLNDEFHSSYRIRDRQIVVVNRAMPDGGVRFTITVLENRRNEEGNFLPVSFVVNTWDLKNGALQSSEAHHQAWLRVGKFDLPQTLLVVTAKEGKQEARSLKLSNHQLLH